MKLQDIPADTRVIAIDPGFHTGVALLDAAGGLLGSVVTDTAALAALRVPSGTTVVVGNGTGSRAVQIQLEQLGIDHELLDETGTSIEGRELYRELQPARGWRRLLPRGLRPSPHDLDAWAAYALGRRWLALRNLR